MGVPLASVPDSDDLHLAVTLAYGQDVIANHEATSAGNQGDLGHTGKLRQISPGEFEPLDDFPRGCRIPLGYVSDLS